MLPCQTFLDMCKLKNGFQFVCGKLGGPGMSLLWLKAKCQTYTCPSHPYLCSRSLWSMRQKTFSMLPIQPVMWSSKVWNQKGVKVWRVATVVCCISARLQPFESCCQLLQRFGKSKSISVSIYQIGVCGCRTFRPFEVRGDPAWGQTPSTKATAFAGCLSPSLDARRGDMHQGNNGAQPANTQSFCTWMVSTW